MTYSSIDELCESTFGCVPTLLNVKTFSYNCLRYVLFAINFYDQF